MQNKDSELRTNENMKRHSIAVVHPRLVIGGGSESTAVWAVQALQDEFNVSLITMGTVDLPGLNDCFGANLDDKRFKIVSLPIPRLARGNKFIALRGYRLVRYVQDHSREYDVIFSSYNVVDFGRKGIQYIADFSFDETINRTLNPALKGIMSLPYRRTWLRSAYLGLAHSLEGRRGQGWRDNLTISNSVWTQGMMKKFYGLDSEVIYHPVVSSFPSYAWEQRENGFVCIGRIVQEKRLDIIIDILDRVRQKGHDIHLHIHGGSTDTAYKSRIERLCKHHSSWIFLGPGIFGDQKADLIARHRYGLHGRENEPFGIAVAELIKAGCITWAPNSGGPIEIVNHPELIYNSPDEAVQKIELVLASSVRQRKLLKHIETQGRKFSTVRFMTEIRRVMNLFLEKDAKERGMEETS